MLRSVFFFIFTAIIIEIACTISVGYIQNAKYVSNDTTIIITYTNTCTECICSGFFFSVPSLYVGLNCYKNNKTCELFANYSTPSMMTMNLNSTFIFIQQPPVQNTTTVTTTPTMTTTTTKITTTATTTTTTTTKTTTTATTTTTTTTKTTTTATTTTTTTTKTTTTATTTTTTTTKTTTTATTTTTTTTKTTTTTSKTTTTATTTTTTTTKTTTTTSKTTTTTTRTTTTTTKTTTTTSKTTTTATRTTTTTTKTTITTSKTTTTTTPLCSLGATFSDPCNGNPPTSPYIYPDGTAHCRKNATGYLARSYTFNCNSYATCYADSDCGQDGFCDQYCVIYGCSSYCNQNSGNCGKLATGLNCGVAYNP